MGGIEIDVAGADDGVVTVGLDSDGDELNLHVDHNDLVRISNIDPAAGTATVRVFASTRDSDGVLWQGDVNIAGHLRDDPAAAVVGQPPQPGRTTGAVLYVTGWDDAAVVDIADDAMLHVSPGVRFHVYRQLLIVVTSELPVAVARHLPGGSPPAARREHPHDVGDHSDVQ